LSRGGSPILPYTMLASLSLPAKDLPSEQRFYDAILATIDYTFSHTDSGAVYTSSRYTSFQLAPYRDYPHPMLFFQASSPAQVDAFYAAAVAAGGESVKLPGFHPNNALIYSAQLLDPDNRLLLCGCPWPFDTSSFDSWPVILGITGISSFLESSD
jgi:predicted lactoylglutathione lyase